MNRKAMSFVRIILLIFIVIFLYFLIKFGWNGRAMVASFASLFN